MIVVSYDISNDKLRTRFSKFLEKFGYRMQYSVFSVRNSDRILENIRTEIENRFARRFTENDSIIIFRIDKQSGVERFGYAKHEDEDLIIV